MFWRRATPAAAWITVLFTLLAFFVVPALLPRIMPSLAEHQGYAATNDLVTTVVTRSVAPADIARRDAAIELWHEKVRDWVKQGASKSDTEAVDRFGPCPEKLQPGQKIEDTFTVGGKPIYWTGAVEPVGVEKLKQIERTQVDDSTVVIRQQYACPLKGRGRFRIDFLLYDLLGVPLRKMPNAALETLRLPTRVVLPFLVIVLFSLVTPRGDKRVLDRFYVKMKTPVDPNPELDRREMEASYREPWRFDDRRLLPRFGLEIQRPNLADVVGFVVCFAVCFLLIWVTVWLAKFGS